MAAGAQDAPSLDGAQVRQLAGLVFDQAEQQRGEIEQLGPPADGSPLAGDDRAAHPHKASQAAIRALRAATEHLDALRALLLQARLMHPAAPYTLIRASLETGATAVWLLRPPARPERVLRSLRLSVQDAIDGTKAAEELGAVMPRPLAVRRAEIDRLARNVDRDVKIPLQPASGTAIVSAADDCSSFGALAMWRICSGFAHGRLWTTLSFLEREVVELDTPGDVGLLVTNSWDRLTPAALAAVDVIAHGLTLYRERAISPYASRRPPDF